MRRTSTLNADALEKMMEKYGGVKKEVKGAEFISKVGMDANGGRRRIVCMIVNIRSYYQRTELLTNDETYCESCLTHTKNMTDEEQKCRAPRLASVDHRCSALGEASQADLLWGGEPALRSA